MEQFSTIYNKVINDLDVNLPDYLTYHNSSHTKLVLGKAIFIGEMESISNAELLLLKIAALYHDTGYKISAVNHETESCRFAEIDLPQFGFGEGDIEQICGMIMATKLPQQPQNHLECILADADLEYLGTDQFETISDDLYAELKYFKPEMTLKQWYDMQISFISKHSYHTGFCRKYREPFKLENLKTVQEKALMLL